MMDKIERTRGEVLKLGCYTVPLTKKNKKKNVVVFKLHRTCSKLAFILSSGCDIMWKKVRV